MTFEENLINEVRTHPIVWNKWNEDYKNRLKSEKEWAIIARNLNKTTNEVKTRWRNLRDVFQKELKKVHKPRSGDPGSPGSLGNYSGKWTYFHHMTFLKDVMVPRQTHSNYGVNDDESQSEQSVNWEFEIDNSSRSEEIPQLPDRNNSTDEDEALSIVRERIICSQSASTSSLEHNAISQSASTSSLERNVSQSASTSSLDRSQGKKHKKSTCSEFEIKMLKIEEDKIKAFKEARNEVDDADMLFLKSLAPYFQYLSPVQKLRLKSKIQNVIADEIALTTSPSPSNSSYSASILPSPVHSNMVTSPPSQTRQFYETFNDDV
ncbi:uncharacterized protein LOC123694094 [Colias croceus]|uniref:uncharacterized protein LOC123694094 n=1 Tax=Colias crocea TaxID=72248 RepID=UPI001E27F60E|nr:uncharacterized protein LOC123694094 [Colias croceus]